MSTTGQHLASTRRALHRMGTTIIFGIVKGMATAAGGAIVTALIWWTEHH